MSTVLDSLNNTTWGRAYLCQQRVLNPNLSDSEIVENANGLFFICFNFLLGDQRIQFDLHRPGFIGRNGRRVTTESVAETLRDPQTTIRDIYFFKPGTDRECGVMHSSAPFALKEDRTTILHCKYFQYTDSKLKICCSETEQVYDWSDCEPRKRIMTCSYVGKGTKEIFDITGRFYFITGDNVVQVADTTVKQFSDRMYYLYNMRILGFSPEEAIDGLMKVNRLKPIEILDMVEAWPCLLMTKQDIKDCMRQSYAKAIMDADKAFNEKYNAPELNRKGIWKKQKGVKLKESKSANCSSDQLFDSIFESLGETRQSVRPSAVVNNGSGVSISSTNSGVVGAANSMYQRVMQRLQRLESQSNGEPGVNPATEIRLDD